MSSEIVVYYYSDPAFSGDLGPALDDLRRRGHRVVKGDNADELLFLLQMGRPVAVIYTLATDDSASSTAYQMVSRRVLDLLVPLILVGPENPRDGVSLLFPEGRAVSRHHVPFHSVATLVERFAEAPPGTPSRPPEMLQNRTIGRGRTVLNWQAAVTDARQVEPPDTSELHSPEKDKLLPSRPAPLPPQPPPDKKTVRMMAPPAAGQGKSPSHPPGGAPPVASPVQVFSGKQTLVAVSVPAPRSDNGPRPGDRPTGDLPAAGGSRVSVRTPAAAPGAAPDGSHRGRLLVMAMIAGLLAAVGAIAIVIWFATRPAAPPPRPLPAVAPALVPAPALPATPAVGTQAAPAAEEEPSGEVERPASAVPASTAARNAPVAGLAFGTEEPFPAHFRENT
ncbi:MAG TPA: hypothetical protein VM285_02885, partial [Polyangia bacterium]|nr:hypothetical protein [Polyangia bacterium]